MTVELTERSRRDETVGLLLGALGVLAFSVSMPATKAAVPVFGSLTVGLGRAVIAAMLAWGTIVVRRVPRPNAAQVRGLVVIALGVVVGFPVFTAWALLYVSSGRSAIVIGLLPAATAATAAIRNGERPSWGFCLAALAGLLTVLVFVSVTKSQGGLHPADLLLLFAVVAAAIGYSEGARLSAQLGSWQTICWAVVVALPVTVPVAILGLALHGLHRPTVGSVAGFAYLSAVSMFLGFFAWYAGLARGGVARVSQIQLMQPVLTLGWSALLLGERIGRAAIIAAVLVLICVALTKRASVRVVAVPGRSRLDRLGS